MCINISCAAEPTDGLIGYKAAGWLVRGWVFDTASVTLARARKVWKPVQCQLDPHPAFTPQFCPHTCYWAVVRAADAPERLLLYH